VAAPDLNPQPLTEAPTVDSRWRKRRRRITNRLGWWCGPTLVWLLVRSWRIRVIDQELRDGAHSKAGGPIIVFWHQQILSSIGTHLGFPVHVLMSHHRDGALVARIAGKLGYGILRGSSSAGGAPGLRGMLRAAQGPYAVGITPDGPRGPAFQFAPGAFFLSAMLQRPLLATGYAASRYWQLGSWDQMIIPKPFARVVVAYQDLAEIPPRAAAKPGPAQEALREQLAAAMDAAARKAAAALEPRS